MPLARNIFTVALFGDVTGSGCHRSIERRVVPQRADSVVPRLELLLAREAGRLRSHPLRNRQDASAAAGREIATDDVRQGATVADDRRNAVDHRFGGNATERLFPD